MNCNIKKNNISPESQQEIVEKLINGEYDFLNKDDKFKFSCEQCGKCCRNRDDIIIYPFDFYHMVRATGKEPLEVAEKYTYCYIGSNSNIPLMSLKYREEPDGNTICYFLGKKDGKYYCRIHDDKPFVCREYPLGRTSSPSKNIEFKYFCQETECAGSNRSKKEHIMQKVVDWVGGEKRLLLSEKASSTLITFIDEFNKIFDTNKYNKLTYEEKNKFYNVLMVFIYFNYDFTVDDDTYLECLKKNLDEMLYFVKEVMK